MYNLYTATDGSQIVRILEHRLQSARYTFLKVHSKERTVSVSRVAFMLKIQNRNDLE
jgi:hypothetical protein